MVITYVIDAFGDKTNGTTITAMRTAERLVALGHEVRIIAYISEKTKEEDLKNLKVLNCRKIAIHPFQKLIESNGFMFADIDEKEIAEFIKGSDIVHILVPFILEEKVRKVAKCLGIPVSGAYHLQPDTISYNLHMGTSVLVNDFIYRLFDNIMYKKLRTVHTPSQTMKDLMIEHGYKSQIYAISNGVSPKFKKMEVNKPEELKNKFVILMIGRLSGEKKQDVLIKAIGNSKYNDKIQLILCGQGPNKKRYLKLSKKYLKNQVIINLVSQEELVKIINYSDLYVHSSDIESEAISCIEAFSCGKVAIISDSPYSATNHFAQDDKCLFHAGDYLELKDRIEYFIEHEDERKSLEKKYEEYGKTFDIDSKVLELVKMWESEIALDKEDKKNHKAYYTNKKEIKKLKKTAKKAKIDSQFIY